MSEENKLIFFYSIWNLTLKIFKYSSHQVKRLPKSLKYLALILHRNKRRNSLNSWNVTIRNQKIKKVNSNFRILYPADSNQAKHLLKTRIRLFRKIQLEISHYQTKYFKSRSNLMITLLEFITFWLFFLRTIIFTISTKKLIHWLTQEPNFY